MIKYKKKINWMIPLKFWEVQQEKKEIKKKKSINA
jgi:hypothetical protein